MGKHKRPLISPASPKKNGYLCKVNAIKPSLLPQRPKTALLFKSLKDQGAFSTSMNLYKRLFLGSS